MDVKTQSNRNVYLIQRRMHQTQNYLDNAFWTQLASFHNNGFNVFRIIKSKNHKLWDVVNKI